MKWLMVLITTMIAVPSLWACDLCNFYQNIYPHDGMSVVGIRYRFSRYEGEPMLHLMRLAETAHGSSARIESYNNIEVWGRAYLTKKWFVEAIVPYRMNHATTEGSRRGVGDAVVMGHYHVIDAGQGEWEAIKHRVSVGAGIKLSTGTFDAGGDPHLQTGTGSTDFILSGGYVVKKSRTGFVVNCSYGINGVNRDRYRFANRFNGSTSAFHQFKLDRWILAPHLGGYFEYSQEDRHEGQPMRGTGGSATLIMTGIDISVGRLGLMISYQYPIYQSEHGIDNQYRLVAGLTTTLGNTD